MNSLFEGGELIWSITSTHLPLKASLSDVFLWAGQGDIGFAILILAIISCMAIAFQGALYVYGYLLVMSEEKNIAQKKNTIQEFILMKEIQGELEREMEDALLNASLRENGSEA